MYLQSCQNSNIISKLKCCFPWKRMFQFLLHENFDLELKEMIHVYNLNLRILIYNRSQLIHFFCSVFRRWKRKWIRSDRPANWPKMTVCDIFIGFSKNGWKRPGCFLERQTIHDSRSCDFASKWTTFLLIRLIPQPQKLWRWWQLLRMNSWNGGQIQQTLRRLQWKRLGISIWIEDRHMPSEFLEVLSQFFFHTSKNHSFFITYSRTLELGCHWPGLCLFSCYQPSCVVPTELILSIICPPPPSRTRDCNSMSLIWRQPCGNWVRLKPNEQVLRRESRPWLMWEVAVSAYKTTLFPIQSIRFFFCFIDSIFLSHHPPVQHDFQRVI